MAASNVLVVDGSGVSRELVARILANTLPEASVATCANGSEALNSLAQNSYTFITTSLRLPDMDGLDLCRAIRQSQHPRPVIVISGEGEQRLLKEGLAAGVTAYFDKWKGFSAFADFIRDFCQRCHRPAGRVLFVEDSRTAALVTLRALERHGLQVTHVTSAEQALVCLEGMRRGEAHYDLVITDYFLREAMSGGDLLQAIRVRYRFSRQALPVLLITGQEDQKILMAALHAGVNDFVQKPVVEEVLMARVQSMLLIRELHEALRPEYHRPEPVRTGFVTNLPQ